MLESMRKIFKKKEEISLVRFYDRTYNTCVHLRVKMGNKEPQKVLQLQLLEWFYSKIGTDQNEIKEILKESIEFQIAVATEYKKAICKGFQINSENVERYLQTKNFSDIVPVWYWIENDALQADKDDLRKIFFDLDKGDIPYKIIVLNIILSIELIPSYQQLIDLWSEEDNEIKYLVSKLMALYAKIADSFFIEAENFIIDKIFNLKENNYLQFYILVSLINELYDKDKDQLIQRLKVNNIDKIFEQQMMESFEVYEREDFLYYPVLAERKSKIITRLDKQQYEDMIEQLQLILSKYQDDGDIVLEFLVPQNQIDPRVKELEQNISDQNLIISKLSTEINMLYDRNQILIAQIIQTQKETEEKIKNCTCNRMVEYTVGIKPGKYGDQKEESLQQEGTQNQFDNLKIYDLFETINNHRQQQSQKTDQKINGKTSEKDSPPENNFTPENKPSPKNNHTPVNQILPGIGLPPPPPPPGRNGPPAPPPLRAKNSAVKETIGVKLKPIIWDELKNEILQNSIWTQISEEIQAIYSKISQELIIENFGIIDKTDKSKPQIIEQQRVNKITYLEANRNQNIQICLQSIKMDIDELVQAIQNMDIDYLAPEIDGKRKSDKLETIQKIIPKPEEIKVYENIKDLDNLQVSDILIIKISKIPLFKERIDAMYELIECPQQEAKIHIFTNDLATLVKQLLNDRELIDVLKYIMAYGNYLNQINFRKNYKGVKISQILTINTKTNKSNRNFLYFIIKQMVQDGYEFQLNYDFSQLDKYSNQNNKLTNLDEFIKEFKQYQPSIQILCSKEDHKTYLDLLNYIDNSIIILENEKKGIEEDSKKLTYLFGEDPKQVSFDVLLGYVKDLISKILLILKVIEVEDKVDEEKQKKQKIQELIDQRMQQRKRN